MWHFLLSVTMTHLNRSWLILRGIWKNMGEFWFEMKERKGCFLLVLFYLHDTGVVFRRFQLISNSETTNNQRLLHFWLTLDFLSKAALEIVEGEIDAPLTTTG